MAAPDPQIGPIVSEWRSLNSKITDKTKECEKVREQLVERKKEHAAIASSWEEQKLTTENTIDAVLQHVAQKRQELAAMEKETLALSVKVQERKRKIEDDSRVIRMREEAVERKLKDVVEHEKAARSRLEDFREARDASRAKLLRNLEKLRAQVPQEAEQHRQALANLESRTSEIEKLIEQEAEAWDAECCRREIDSRAEVERILQMELQSVSDAKSAWSDALGKLNSQCGRHSQMTAELSHLRELVARTRD